MRSTNDFKSFEAYQVFLKELVDQYNHKYIESIEEERAALGVLPVARGIDYEDAVVLVASTSTITLRRVTYTLPSSFIGKPVAVKLYHDRLDCFLGSVHILTLERIYPARGQHGYQIDYRHLIDSLRKKPGAFQRAILRDYILPNDNYRMIWKHIYETLDSREA